MNKGINIEIDKLTRSIENNITGDSFKTEILPILSKEIKKIEWIFDWKSEMKTNRKKFIN